MQEIEVRTFPAASSALGTIKSKWLCVTPSQARSWLASADALQTRTSRNNRTRSAHTVSAYTRDMRNGHWMTTHQGIAFDERGVLIDGQHRLAAIAENGAAQWMLVTFGLPPSAKLAIDRGRIRAIADQLQIYGDPDASRNVVATCNAINTQREWIRRDKLTAHEILAVMSDYREPIMCAQSMSAHHAGVGHSSYRAALAGACYANLDNSEALRRIEVFARIVRDGTLIPMDWNADPGLASTPLSLRKILTGESRRKDIASARERAGLIFAATERAIEAFLENVPLKRIHAPVGQPPIFDMPRPDFAALAVDSEDLRPTGS